MVQYSNSKRLAKNTIMLYIRMLLNMVISLYTSRLILQVLGIDDYGIYNVVGGLVAMFTFMQSALTSATQRFLNYALGENNFHQTQMTFSTSVYIHIFMAIIVLLLAESIGLWFFHEKLVIPENRMHAALWTYQLSILSCVIILVSLPYNAIIIAHEKMSAFAYISIFEGCAKLLIVYLLLIVNHDKLISYAILMFCIQLLIRIIYQYYSNKHFPETKLIWSINKKLIKSLSNFTIWNLLGNIAMIGLTQGVNILLNMFAGLAVNAARAIAVQVQGAINGFCQNFQVAINPQIYKSCAAKDYQYMISLVHRRCKFSFFVLFILALPFFFEIEQVLHIWLTEVPTYTADFIRIMLAISLVDSISNGIGAAIIANGQIKYYQITNSIILLLVIPSSYIMLSANFHPLWVFIIQLFFDIIAQIVRLFYARHYVPFSIKTFFHSVYLRIGIVTILSCIIPGLYFYFMPSSFLRLILLSGTSVITSIIIIYFIGMSYNEKMMIKETIYKKLHKNNKQII